MSGCDVNTGSWSGGGPKMRVSKVGNDRSKRVGDGRGRGMQAAFLEKGRTQFSPEVPEEMEP